MKRWGGGGGHILGSSYAVGKSTYVDHNVWSYNGRWGGGGYKLFRLIEGYRKYIDKTQTQITTKANRRQGRRHLHQP